ncbi:toxic anion resistance protein [uncultured Eubacterium sp.]|uniref:toxic anion resistance protein n=1 Tax=uncultured Eubacterium sp. TaxID=165185 RepID=UPI002593B960|nr:toxic anion resistance protein [uncultured Eubacterium sp.]
MDNEFKDFTTTPTLTFDVAPETKEAPAAASSSELAEQAADPAFSENNLTPEELQMVNEFSQKIDLHNSQAILQYGVGTQKKMADFSEAALNNVRTKDLGEVGNMLSSLVIDLKSFDVTEQDKGFKGLFKKSSNKITSMKAKYDKAEVNVNNVCTALENHQVTLMKDIALLDKMYAVNLTYFKELSMYILAGKKKLEEVRNGELAAAVAKANASNLPEDAQAAKDLQSMCDRFEKKIHDLELTRMISIQTAPQIRMVQNNDTLMAEKIQSTIVNTIPLWKSQMVLALGIEHSAQAAKAQREVTDMTNELLRKNADILKTATIDTAKESERGIVDLETLKHTNESLISTFDEVLKIQTEGREKRRNAEAEMQRMEDELKKKLLEIRN